MLGQRNKANEFNFYFFLLNHLLPVFDCLSSPESLVSIWIGLLLHVAISSRTHGKYQLLLYIQQATTLTSDRSICVTAI